MIYEMQNHNIKKGYVTIVSLIRLGPHGIY